MSKPACVSIHAESTAGVHDISVDTDVKLAPRVHIGGAATLFIWDDYSAYGLLDAAQAVVKWYEDRADRDGNP